MCESDNGVDIDLVDDVVDKLLSACEEEDLCVDEDQLRRGIEERIITWCKAKAREEFDADDSEEEDECLPDILAELADDEDMLEELVEEFCEQIKTEIKNSPAQLEEDAELAKANELLGAKAVNLLVYRVDDKFKHSELYPSKARIRRNLAARIQAWVEAHSKPDQVLLQLARCLDGFLGWHMDDELTKHIADQIEAEMRAEGATVDPGMRKQAEAGHEWPVTLSDLMGEEIPESGMEEYGVEPGDELEMEFNPTDMSEPESWEGPDIRVTIKINKDGCIDDIEGACYTIGDPRSEDVGFNSRQETELARAVALNLGIKQRT